MAPRPNGGLWILDRAADEADPDHARYWALDRYFRVIVQDQPETTLTPLQVDDFQPKTGPIRQKPGRTFPLGISLEMASPLAVRFPVALEALPDGSVLILESDPALAYSVVYRYRFGEVLGEQSLEFGLEAFIDQEPTPEHPQPEALQGYDLAFIPNRSPGAGRVTGTLYIVASDSNQAFAFRLEADDDLFALDLVDQYLPLRRFSGKALVAYRGTVYYDLGQRWMPLVEQPRPRYEPKGVLTTDFFDGKEPDCTWHRLFLDGCIPPGAEVRLESRAANDATLLSTKSWQAEPRLHRRATGAETPYYQPFHPNVARKEGTGTWELLFQRAEGRYLQLRLTLRGTGRNTPRLHALRAYYPRFSYLEAYLPAVYREDAPSASFLDRFLANVEGTYTVTEGRIAEAQTLFDVRTVPSEYLDWLAGWFGLLLEPTWEEFRRRLFIKHAMELFAQHGTPAGLIRMIRLATDPCPDDSLFEEDIEACSTGACVQGHRFDVRIVEQFLTRSAPGVIYGDPTDLAGPRLTISSAPWTPDQGAVPLHQQYQSFLKKHYGTVNALNTAWGATYSAFAEVLLSPVRPAHATQADDWRQFVTNELGFTYAEVTSTDTPHYQAFLARRYRQIDRLETAYQRTYTTFDQVSLPGEDDFPDSGPRLYDWIQFVSLVLPIRRNAHHFTVLVPINAGEDPETQQRELDLVQRIVEVEKPAHAYFEVKPYWALFRVGEARLGLDTLLGVGSRFAAVLLGRSYLAEGYLTAPHPWDVADRIVTGRDDAGSAMVL